MIYLTGVDSPEAREIAAAGHALGVLAQPDGERAPLLDAYPAGWAADNGCFAGARFDAGRWWAWLEAMPRTALFATAPDVVGDAAATLTRSLPWLDELRAAGWRPAFVAQDGQEALPVPWEAFDCLFVGGSTAWKTSHHAADLIGEALDRGRWVHMGRVNSQRRLVLAQRFGCHSADGTYLKFGPTVNAPKMLRWLRHVHANPTLV